MKSYCVLLVMVFIPKLASAQCKTGEMRSHPDLCERYLVCANDVFVEMFCPTGLFFNPELNVCDWPNNVNCTSAWTTTTEVLPTTTTEVLPTTTKVLPTTTEVLPTTTTEVLPTTTTEVLPTTTEVLPTTTEVLPTTTGVRPTTTEVLPTTTEVLPTTTPPITIPPTTTPPITIPPTTTPPITIPPTTTPPITTPPITIPPTTTPPITIPPTTTPPITIPPITIPPTTTPPITIPPTTTPPITIPPTTTPPTTTPPPTTVAVPLYRLFHSGLNNHFYTTSEYESNNAVYNLGYILEGVAGFVSVSPGGCQLAPVYRLLKETNNFHNHFYTTNAYEASLAESVHGYKPEGTPFYCAAEPNICGASTPFYRYNRNSGHHLYTTSISEGNNIIATGGTFEGIMCYIWT